MSEIISDHTLASWEKCFKQQIHSAMAPISPGTLLEWVAEIRRLRELNAGLEPLARLGLEAVEECSWQGCNFDGGDIQESAVKAGAIREAAEGYDPAVHGESDICELGDRWFEFQPTVLAAKRWLEEDK